MKKTRFFCSVILCLCMVMFCCSIVSAEDYDPKIETLDEYNFESETNYAKIITPVVSGMGNKTEEDLLNSYFVDTAAQLKADFEQQLADFEAEAEDDMMPHFGVEYTYHVVADTPEVYSFYVEAFHAAGSSSAVTRYFTIDKDDGDLFFLMDEFDDGEDYMPVIIDYIKEQMTEMNKDGEHAFWLGTEFEPEMDKAFASIEENNHYYLDENDDLVIVFDKYEVAPGAYGQYSFVIPESILDRIDD